MKQMIFSALGFVIVMFISILISNPYLLIPSEFNQFIQIMTRQASAQSSGWTLTYSRGISAWLPIVTHRYGSIPFWLAICSCLIFSITHKSTRTWGLLLLSWTLPLSIYILFFTAIKPTHFLLPVAIPTLALLLVPFDPLTSISTTKTNWAKWIKIGLASIFILQFGQNLITDINIYKEKLQREQANSIIQFYEQFSNQYMSQLDNSDEVKVLRDIRAYFPSSGNVKVSEFYNTLTLGQLQNKHPDILILWKQRIRDYTSQKSGSQAIDPDSFRLIQSFFSNAKSHTIPGYQVLMENDAIIAFISQPFAEEHQLITNK